MPEPPAPAAPAPASAVPASPAPRATPSAPAALPSSPPLAITDARLFATLADRPTHSGGSGAAYSPLRSPARDLTEAKRAIVDRLSLEARRAALAAADARKRDAEIAMADLRRRAGDIPAAALELEQRLVSSLGSASAEGHTVRIRDVADRMRAARASAALMALAAKSPSLLQHWNDAAA